jgi:hypothetical protein
MRNTFWRGNKEIKCEVETFVKCDLDVSKRKNQCAIADMKSDSRLIAPAKRPSESKREADPGWPTTCTHVGYRMLSLEGHEMR